MLLSAAEKDPVSSSLLISSVVQLVLLEAATSGRSPVLQLDDPIGAPG